MPATISTIQPRTTLVPSTSLPDLLVSIVNGELSINLGFENAPSGSISANDIHLDEIGTYRSKYRDRLDNRLDIFGIPFIINGYAEAKRVIHVEEDDIEVYDVSISLGSWWASIGSKNVLVWGASTPINYVSGNSNIAVNTLASKAGISYSGPSFLVDLPSFPNPYQTFSFISTITNYARVQGGFLKYSDSNAFRIQKLDDATSIWQFNESDILYNIETSVNTAPSYYKADMGTYFYTATDFNSVNQTKTLLSGQTQYQRLSNTTIELKEGDTNLTSPPVNSTVLRDFSSNFDQSGPRKTEKVTTLVNGVVRTEKVKTYGFAYLGKDIYSGGIYQGSPSAWWRLIDEYTTTYTYNPVSNGVGSVRITLNNGEKVNAYFLGGDSYTAFLQGASYLVSSVTKGVKLMRVQSEEAEGTFSSVKASETINSTSSSETAKKKALQALNAVSFEMVSYTSATSYSLESGADASTTPFSVQRTTPAELGDNIPVDKEGYCYVLIPDPNYIPPMLVTKEESITGSVLVKDNPENVGKSSTAIKLPPLITGEESYFRTLRTEKQINSNLPSNAVGSNTQYLYTEYEANESSQDAGFSSSLANVRFREVLGRMPQGTSTRPQFVALFLDPSINPTFIQQQRLICTSDLQNRLTPEGESSSYNAKTIADATTAIKTDLNIRHLTDTIREEVKLAYFYPYIREGDYIELDTSDLSSLPRRVLGVNFTLRYSGYIIDNGEVVPRVFCEGTKVSLGEYRQRNVSITQQPANLNIIGTSTTFLGTQIAGPLLTLNQNNRRNFDFSPNT